LTKREFAAKLLMWLLPWPISKVLPRSFRIYYFGPAGGPPPGFYDYWGEPGFYWPDPSIPPDPDLFPDLPDDIFNPGDPVNPPDPGDFPDFPNGPTNPSNPYTPGPGAGSPPRQPNPNYPYFDDSWWEPLNAPPLLGEWDAVNKEWDSTWSFNIQWVHLLPIGGWENGWRANGVVFKSTGGVITKMDAKDTGGNSILNVNLPVNYVYYYFDWSNLLDIEYLRWYQSDDDEFSITDIRFF